MRRTPIVNPDDRRLAAVLAHRCAIVIEAPAGYGKTRLLEQIADQVGDPCLVTDPADLRSLADRAESADATTILVDLAFYLQMVWSLAKHGLVDESAVKINERFLASILITPGGRVSVVQLLPRSSLRCRPTYDWKIVSSWASVGESAMESLHMLLMPLARASQPGRAGPSRGGSWPSRW